MKKIFLLITFTLAMVFAGVFIGENAYAESSAAPWNVDVEVVHGGDVFAYSLRENIADCKEQADDRGFYSGYNGRKALFDSLVERQLPLPAVYEYIFPGFGKLLRHFGYVDRIKTDAEVTFSADGFCYKEGNDGVKVDSQKLFDGMLRSKGKKIKIRLPLSIDRAVTVAELKRNTVKKASFTTYYPSSGENRCYNISKAAASLNGVTVGVNETFSFNDIVGERTEANGYKTSKVIMDGNYTDGVGGGVCQVSSTLYNALLLAGFLPKAVAHSLVSSYVKVGFDAMVSYGAADLTFVNDTDHPIYISAVTRGKSVTFTVYGEPNKYRIERESVETRDKFAVIEVIDSVKYPELIYSDQIKVITSGSDGVKSRSYLKYYIGNELVQTKLIRQNSYKRVDKVIARGAIERPAEEYDAR